MPKISAIKLLYALFSICFIANTALIIFRDDDTTTQHSELTRVTNACCVELCSNGLNFRSNQLADYSLIADKMPTIDDSYHSTMIRLGLDLDFDKNHCPASSYMRNRKSDFHPKHLNCPTFFLVGARKGGTSSLYQFVSKHPDFEGTKLDAGPKAGETFYFSKFYKVRPWESYISLFPPDGVMTGDASVGNLVHRLAPKRLYEACGKQAKVVMLFRDPIKRLESNFLMRSRYQKAKMGNHTKAISPIVKRELDTYFQTALSKTLNVKDLPKEWSKLVGLFPPAHNMVFEGVYYVHLLNWLCNFPAENIMIINSEEFYRHPSKILDYVFQFLELQKLDSETHDWITSEVYNKGDYDVPLHQRLSRTDMTNLLGVYRPFNKALLDLLQWNDCNWMMNT